MVPNELEIESGRKRPAFERNSNNASCLPIYGYFSVRLMLTGSTARPRGSALTDGMRNVAVAEYGTIRITFALAHG